MASFGAFPFLRWRAGSAALRTALGKLRLRIGIELFGQFDRLKALFPQHLLGFPMEEAPLPGALEITSATQENATTARINYAATGAENATEIAVQYKVVGTATWSAEIPATLPTQLISRPEFEQETVEFRVVTRNTSGETFSAVVAGAF